MNAQLTRNELVNLPCWSCWMREGFKCYDTEHFGALPVENGHPVGRPITAELPGKVCPGYKSKRAVLGQFFDDIIIVSEQEHP